MNDITMYYLFTVAAALHIIVLMGCIAYATYRTYLYTGRHLRSWKDKRDAQRHLDKMYKDNKAANDTPPIEQYTIPGYRYSHTINGQAIYVPTSPLPINEMLPDGHAYLMDDDARTDTTAPPPQHSADREDMLYNWVDD